MYWLETNIFDFEIDTKDDRGKSEICSAQSVQEESRSQLIVAKVKKRYLHLDKCRDQRQMEM